MVSLEKADAIVRTMFGIGAVVTGIAAIIIAVIVGLWADQNHRNFRTLVSNQANQSKEQLAELKTLVSIQGNLTEQVNNSLEGQIALLSELTNTASGMTQTLTTMSQHLSTMDNHLVTQTNVLRDIAEQLKRPPDTRHLKALAALLSKPVVPGATTIDAVAAKFLFDRDAVFIDVRGDEYWASGRIAGAIHLALNAGVFTKDALSKVADKDQEVVIYCMGPGCRKASVACARAVAWNFKKVYYFRDGYPSWETAGYPVERNGTMN